MKKVLLFVLAAFFACYTMNAQVLFSDDFEGTDLSAWTLYDNDGDTYGWQLYTYNPHGGAQSAMSASYYGGSALTPDNWMVTPAITIPEAGYTLEWYVAAQDPSYAQEQYSVYIATANTVDAFLATTAVHNETLTDSSWRQHTIDLSSYAGQTIYVAFRHHDVTDMFYMKIDDVSISKPATEPEIHLVNLTTPSSISVGGSFNVTGNVSNTSSVALTSFDVTYTVDGGTPAATYTVTGINVAYGETYAFTHNVPATLSTGGSHTITVTVSNPNGVADNTSDNTLTANVTACDVISTLPYTNDFEGGMNCWSAVSMNTENESTMGTESAYASYCTPNSGTGIFVFSSYEEADDYSQYLISPELNLPSPTQLDFYHISGYNNTETIQIMTSTTTSDISSFTNLGDEITVTTTGEHATAVIPANVKYIAIKYTSEYLYFIGIDDITLTTMSTDPEIALTSITTPTVVDENATVNVSGIVTNNSAAALTSFDVAYTFDGTTSATYNVTGINVAAGETYAFTHNTPITNIAGGSHTLSVTVSNPNATADNTADNTLSTTINVCAVVTDLPYTESFDVADFGCWQNIDADGDGIAWNHITDLLSDPSGATSYSYNGSANCLASFSYLNYETYNTDHWLISPAIQIPSTGTYAATWYAKNQDADYPDSYSVYIATSSDIATLQASGSVLEDTPSDEYESKAVMLDNYAGQTIYIALRHNDSDKFILFIDEFSVKEVSTEPEIALTAAATNPAQVAMNTAYVVNATVVNNSGAALTSFDVACTANGQTTNQQITGINVPFLQSYSFAVDMPAIATSGNYDVTVTVSNPNGTADNTADNTLTTSINIYDASSSVPRTVLLENFTTAVCQYCPQGHEYIASVLQNSTYTNKVIWTSHHSGFYTDDLTVDVDNTMTIFYNDGGGTYAPAAMTDRTRFVTSEPGPVFSVNDVQTALDAALAEPAFVTVNIGNVNYNASTRALTATISGNVTGALATSDARINVWLLEDGLLADGGTGVGHGPTQTNASGTFYHDHVIREVLAGGDWGEAGVVTPTAGTNYTKTISTTVSDNYDASKCYLVAFVSSGDYSDVNNCKVFNSAKGSYLTQGGGSTGINDVENTNVRLYPNPTTGNLFIDVEGLERVEVIDAVGRLVMTQTSGNSINMSNLANGIYTVRVFANGSMSVKKVAKR